MRQHYTPYTMLQKQQWKALRERTAKGMSLQQAADEVGVTLKDARRLVSRSYPAPEEMRERRKDYIVKVMTGPNKHRYTPFVIASFFMIDEQLVVQMINELRRDGMLPKGAPDDEMERWKIISTLQRQYSNVYRAATVGKLRSVGDKLMVQGKGWITWEQAAELAEKVAARLNRKTG